MSHSLFSFLHLLASSRHVSSSSLQPVPCERHVWVSPCRGAPICPQFWVSHCHPSPANPHLPFQGRGATGSCPRHGGLFRQLEPQLMAMILGQGVLLGVTSQPCQRQLYFCETLIFPEGQRSRWSEKVQSACSLPVCRPSVIYGAH